MKKSILVLAFVGMLVLSACGSTATNASSSKALGSSQSTVSSSKAESKTASSEEEKKDDSKQSKSNKQDNTKLFDDLKKKIDEAEKKDKDYQTEIATGKNMTTNSQSRYELWDGLLNTLWDSCKGLKDEAFQKDILEKQRQWIKDKEAAVNKAGQEAKGGSLEKFSQNEKAADMTKERVQELYKIYSK